MGKTEYVTDIKRFYEILLDDRLDNIHTGVPELAPQRK
jgi:hypothetical protein